MKGLDKILVIIGGILILYAVFSRFYGEPSVAMTQFKSSNVLALANTALLLSLVIKNMSK